MSAWSIAANQRNNQIVQPLLSRLSLLILTMTFRRGVESGRGFAEADLPNHSHSAQSLSTRRVLSGNIYLTPLRSKSVALIKTEMMILFSTDQNRGDATPMPPRR